MVTTKFIIQMLLIVNWEKKIAPRHLLTTPWLQARYSWKLKKSCLHNHKMNIGIWDENSFNLIYSIYLLKTGASNESGVKSLVRVKNGFALGKRKDFLVICYNGYGHIILQKERTSVSKR